MGSTFIFQLLFLLIGISLSVAQLTPTVTNKNVSSRISMSDLNECYGVGVQRARILFNTRYPVVNKLNLTEPPKPIADVSGESKPAAREAGYYGAVVEGMVRCLTSQLQLTAQEIQDLVDMQISNSLLSESCLVPEDQYLSMSSTDKMQRMLTPHLAQRQQTQTLSLIKIVHNMIDPNNWCLLYPFRTASGYCNNPMHPEWGTSFRPFKRFLPPDYDDGIGAPRLRSRSTLRLLPNPRKVSTAVHTSEDRPHPVATHMVMQWGQILDHDILHTPQTTDAKGKVPKCCNEINRNPECFPIIIPEDDFFFQHGKKCFEFVRSMAATRPGCHLGPREQINQVTAFLDASMVYGSTEEEMSFLRSFQDGQLRISEPKAHGGVSIQATTARLGSNLPDDEFFDDCVNRFTRKDVDCMRAGDVRVNEHAGLTAIHTLLLRQHNVIAIKLQQVNPHWNDERLFHEARKIVSAIVQRITYKEWLPVVLGRDVMRGYELNVLDTGYANNYNVSEDPTVANVVGAAAFRFGHTLIQGIFDMRDSSSGLVSSRHKLIEMFNQPYRLIRPNEIDQLIKGMCMQRSQRFDRFMDNQITDHLLEDPPGQDGRGQDLMTRNIQRGRDHGIPPYPDWRAACGLEVPQDFDHLRRMNVMGDNAPDILEKLYDSVQDLDLFPAAMSEKALPNAIVGPTIACILGFQFRKLKIGDRFWHENGLAMPSSFTLEKLQEIRRITMARLVCDTTDSISRIQPNAFLDTFVVPGNTQRQCSELPEINFSVWRDDPKDIQNIEAVKFAINHKPIPPYKRPAALGDETNVAPTHSTGIPR